MKYIFKLIKQYYKTFISSYLIWFVIIIISSYMETKYKIPSKYLKNISKEFTLSTALGLTTTIVSALYTYQKDKTKQNQQALKENTKALEAYNTRTTQNTEEIAQNRENIEKYQNFIREAITRLEDTIDQQTFELRRLEDFGNRLEELKIIQFKSNQELNDNIRMIENIINSIQLEQERQKEHLLQSDRIIALSGVLREDIKEREILKNELKETLKIIKENEQ